MKKANYLGDKIYDWRKQKEISQENFANLVGVTRQTVQKWESGLAIPKTDKLQKIGEIIGVELNELISISTNAQSLEEVVADKVAGENEITRKSNDKKHKMSSKAKIIIVAIVLLLTLLMGVFLIVFDKIMSTPNYDGAMDIAKSTTWNFSIENIGWTVFGVSMMIGVILGTILICRLVKRK
ncbi:MAG: helix-turn-helix domain-containing protein [Muribaculaceae bacterium]|nr:helix-turn-helix domain-containing protein [Muribaculaceae bacterium]